VLPRLEFGVEQRRGIIVVFSGQSGLSEPLLRRRCRVSLVAKKQKGRGLDANVSET
jgi:hypothetical protein